MRFVVAKLNRADLDVLGELVAAGKIAPVIDRRYPLSDVAEAIRYVVEEHARGKVIITVEKSNET
jgi:NADPH:quinone reductase-like Zn-dependent oxidoreductase